MANLSFLFLAASVLCVSAFPTGEQLPPNIEQLSKCSATLERNQPICVPPGCNLDFKNIQTWAKDQSKCCNAWKTFHCLKDMTLKEPVCKGVIEEMLAGWAKEVETTFRANGCLPDKCH